MTRAALLLSLAMAWARLYGGCEVSQTTTITITIEHDNDIPEGSKEIADNMAAEAARDSYEVSGGGTVTVRGATHDPEGS